MKPGVDYIGVGVGAFILDAEQRIFLFKRGEQVRNEAGKWNIPGGMVEWGETREAAIVREVYEEVDVKIEILGSLETLDHIIPAEHQHWVTTTFICRIIEGEPKIMEPKKCSELRWATLDEALKLPLTITAEKNLQLWLKRLNTIK